MLQLPVDALRSHETSEDCPIADMLKPGMLIPNVPVPRNFLADQTRTSKAPGLTDFRRGTTTLAFKFQGGVMVAVDSRASMGSYISSGTVRKIIEINPFMLGTMAGGAADCSFWERQLTMICRLHELRHHQRISVSAASQILANIFWNYRGYGLSCGTMIAGADNTGTHLYSIDDTGARVIGDLFSCGSGSPYAYSVLDSGYNWDLTVDEAIKLSKASIYHATHRDGASGGVVRVYHITNEGWKIIEDGQDVGLDYHYNVHVPSKKVDGA